MDDAPAPHSRAMASTAPPIYEDRTALAVMLGVCLFMILASLLGAGLFLYTQRRRRPRTKAETSAVAHVRVPMPVRAESKPSAPRIDTLDLPAKHHFMD